jgi:BirA family transcriptional regulator, biotin operon repressor / biotin---[acetyl-CoA-carboxylase] ligase
VAVDRRLSVHSAAGRGDGARRGGAVLIDRITRVASTGSTNADLLAAAASGQAWSEGAWLVADRQSAGRGRLGRDWRDGAGNFMGSTMVALRASDPPAHTLALVAGLAVHGALGLLGGPPDMQLKWPNDVMIGGAKLAGILLERTGDHIVIGIGINLVQAPDVPGRRTVSLTALGHPVDRDAVAATLAQCMADALTEWRSGGWPTAILTRWHAAAHPRGTALTLSEGEHAGLTGRFDGLEQDGSLALRLGDGRRIIIHAGDVTLAD